MTSRLSLCFLILMLMALQLSAQLPGSAPERPADLTVVVDQSGSMDQNKRLQEAKQAGKLACLILDCRVHFVGFSDEPNPSPVFDLKTQRSDALRWLDSLRASGGTKYVPALKAAAARSPKSIVFISDGEPEEQPEEILELISQQIHCPMHTIAVETSSAARDLLGKMAGRTKGGFHTVEEPAQVVDVFLRILGQVRRFRQLEMTGARLELRDVSGELLAIGFDAVPELAAQATPESVTLSGSHIHFARTTLARPRAVTVTSRGQAGNRVIILRFDQAVAKMSLGQPVVRDGDGRLRAEVTFEDLAGKTIDPRKADSHLSAEFELLGPDGKVLKKVPGQPSPSWPVITATFVVPVKDAARGPYVVRAVSKDRSSGAPFTAADSQVIVIDLQKAQSVPPLTAVTAIKAAGGHAGDPIRGTVTIQTEGGTEDEQKTFFDALLARPPIVAVRGPTNRSTDSATLPDAFAVRTKVENDVFVMEVTHQPEEAGGEFKVSVRGGTAAGTSYPAGQARVRCADSGDLQLLIVAQRQLTKRRVLFDSAQKLRELGHALEGDLISLELVRSGSIDPREFASLGNGLRARFLSDDGAATEVALALQQDRYTTTSVRVKGPGQFRVQVDVAVEGLDLQLSGQIAIEKVATRLALGPSPLVRRLSVLPLGAVVPLNIAVVGQMRSRAPERDELLEVLRRDGLTVRWSLTDSTGTVLASDKRTPDLQMWATQLRLGCTGEMSFTLELLDDQGTVLDSLPWAFKAVDSPVQLSVYVRRGNGELKPLPAEPHTYPWLPRWCVATPQLIVGVKPTRSPFYTSYHLSQVRARGTAAQFDEKAGEFRATVEPGSVECIGTLRPYGWGAANAGDIPEIQVSEYVAVPAYEELHVGRVALGAMGLAVAALALAALLRLVARAWYRRALRSVGLRIRVYGGSGGPMPIVDPEGRGRSAAELLLCGRPGEPESLCFIRPSQLNGQAAAARIRQHVNGSVSVLALTDFPKLKAGHALGLSYPNSPEAVLSASVTLVIESVPKDPAG